VVQYAVKNEKKGSSFCGGGYIKLLPSSTDLSKFGGDSPYHIMFGPDICGYDVSRVHVIFSKDGESAFRARAAAPRHGARLTPPQTRSRRTTSSWSGRTRTSTRTCTVWW